MNDVFATMKFEEIALYVLKWSYNEQMGKEWGEEKCLVPTIEICTASSQIIEWLGKRGIQVFPSPSWFPWLKIWVCFVRLMTPGMKREL
jgi:hypothetical protein